MSGAVNAALPGATTRAETSGRPWYVQFWPLFLVFLMIASIGGSLATVAIAYRHADVDVRASSAVSGRPEAGSPR
jgi:hypothetical protein